MGRLIQIAGIASLRAATPPAPELPASPQRPAHYFWALLIARFHEVLLLLCPVCGGQMRLIAFITRSADIRQILDHIGVDSQPPHITPACGLPLWLDFDAPVDDGVQGERDCEPTEQPRPTTR